MTDNVVPDAVRVRIARHEDDQKAIYRLRYQVYITELNKTNVDNADHEQAWIKDPEDDHPETVLLWAGPPGGITGTMRLRVWQPGQVDKHTCDLYSLKRFPQIEKQRVFEVAS